MKGIFFLVFITFMQVSASSVAQKISLNKRNTSLKEILNDIRYQSGYSLLCDAELLESAGPVTIDVKEVPLTEALELTLSSQPLTFIIKNRTILITSSLPESEAVKDIIVKGKVTDDNNDPLPGVSIKVKGTSQFTSSKADGSFNISVPNRNAVLVFTFIGFTTQEVPLNNRTQINVTLKEENNKLEEVVVIGYGTQKRVSLSAAVSSIKGSDIEDQVTPNALTALVGQLPGMEVKQNTGEPGSNPVIRIRGTGSLGGDVASNSPLFVVDGIPLDDASDFNAINPNDIENIDVLKDAAAAAIYGARGGNGVVLVTTKKGKLGQSSRINFTFYTGIQNVSKKIEMQNTEQHIRYVKELINANWLAQGGDPNVPNGSRVFNGATNNYNWPLLFDKPLDSIPNTDWQSEIYQKNAPMANYQISAQGGSNSLRYFISGNYFNQNGIVRTTGFVRYNARVNLESTFSKKIKAGITFTPSHTRSNRLPTNGHFNTSGNEAGTITSALAMPSFIIPRDANGLYGQLSGTSEYENLGYSSIRSPLQAMYQPEYRNLNTVNRYLSTAFLEFTPFKKVVFRSSAGADVRGNRLSYYRPSTISGTGSAGTVLTPTRPNPVAAIIRANENWNNYLTLTWDNTLTYSRRIKNKHNLSLLAGYSVQKYENENSVVSGRVGTFFNDLIPYPTGATETTGTYTKSEYALISLFGRVNYDYKSKYILSAALRNDASSRFPKGDKDGVFPSVSAAWRLSQERFFKNTAPLQFINDLKVRASYGVTGNYPSQPYPYQAFMSKINYNFNDDLISGFAPSRIETEKLTWETNRQVDLGIDLNMFKSRISVTTDYYHRNTEGLLYTIPIPAIGGFTNAFGNTGEINNKGFELSLSTVNTSKTNLKWSSNFNIAFNRNKLIHLGTDDSDVIRTGDPPLATILRVGEPIGMFYGYKTAGVFMNQADVDANPTMKFNNNSGPGDTKFVDTNGDGVITPADRIPLGNPNPDFSFGFGNQFKYKNFDLSVRVQGVKGGKILFLLERFLGENGRGTNQLVYSTENRWKSEEEPGNGKVPRANLVTKGNSVGLSESSLDRWLQDASYLRIQNVTLSYNVPKRLLSKVKLNSVRAYVTAQNLYTFSNYIGYAPDANYMGETATVQSVDYGTYPQSRTFTLGVNVGL